jgi:hypothetical protein
MNISSRKQRSFKRTVRNYKNANVNARNAALLNANWGDVFLIRQILLMLFTINGLIYLNEILMPIFPFREITVRPKDKPWMNGSIRQAIRRRDRLLN